MELAQKYQEAMKYTFACSVYIIKLDCFPPTKLSILQTLFNMSEGCIVKTILAGLFKRPSLRREKFSFGNVFFLFLSREFN